MLKFILRTFFQSIFDPELFHSHYFKNGYMGYRWALTAYVYRNILRLAPTHRFPIGNQTFVHNFDNIEFCLDDLNNFQSPGCYFQCFKGKIRIGKGTYIGPNVGLITSNHDPNELRGHMPPQNINIGANCWIGMNSIILPGVTLADNTIVGAGSVVTKSSLIPGNTIFGNPAKRSLSK